MNTPLRSAALALALAAASSAFGQVRQIQMNNPLDANPGVGTGGTNTPVPGFVPINGNDIVTGNVTGLGYFHGSSVGSQYSFRAPLPSGGLGGFAARSAPQGPNGMPTTYYLPSTTVSTGQGTLYGSPLGSGFDSRLIPRTSFAPTATSAQLDRMNATVNGAAINRAPEFVAPVSANVAGGVLNNPLFVVRTTEELERQRREQMKNAATRPAIGDTTTTQPSLMINGEVTGARIPGREPNPNLSVPVDQSITGNVGEIFARLADDLKKVQGTTVETPGPAVADVKLSPGAIDPLTGRPRLLASSEPNALPTTGTQLPTTRPGRSDKGSQTLSAKSLESLSTAQLAAGSKLKPLKMATPATSTVTPAPFDLLMTRAEQNLREGKFVDAQFAYQSALANKPEDPLALIGLAHAELGAGAYAPAAYDLKFIFTRKPEMLAVRYDPSSFIPASRQDFLLTDLLKQTANKETAATASFLYCYLCYQTGRTPQLEAELKRWGDRDDKDSWQSVARRAWLGEPK